MVSSRLNGTTKPSWEVRQAAPDDVAQSGFRPGLGAMETNLLVSGSAVSARILGLISGVFVPCFAREFLGIVVC